MFFAQFWILKLLVFVSFFFPVVFLWMYVSSLNIGPGTVEKTKLKNGKTEGWRFIFLFGKDPQRSDVDGGRRVFGSFVSDFYVFDVHVPVSRSGLSDTADRNESGQCWNPTELTKAPCGIYLFDWMKREAADTTVSLSPAITELFFCCCFAVGSA